MFEQLAKNEDLVVKTTLNEHTETLRREEDIIAQWTNA